MDKFYIMKNIKVARFEEVTSKVSNSNKQLKLPYPSLVCVAFDYDLAFRVKVLTIGKALRYTSLIKDLPKLCIQKICTKCAEG